jgi:hypothetical protein
MLTPCAAVRVDNDDGHRLGHGGEPVDRHVGERLDVVALRRVLARTGAHLRLCADLRGL